MTDESATGTDAGEPWLIARPPPPPPPIGSTPPEAGPPVSRTPAVETTRQPVVEPSAPAPPPPAEVSQAPEVPAPPEPPAVAPVDPTVITPAVEAEPVSAVDPTVMTPAVEAEPVSAVDPTVMTPAVEAEPASAGEPDTTAVAPVEAEPTPAGDPDTAPVAPEGTEPAAAAAAAASDPAADTGDADSGPSRPAAMAVAGTAAAKAALTELREQSAWVLGAAAILLAFAINWFVGILLSFRHAHGYSARARILQFFEPGSLSWALAILLALTLITIARKFDPAPARRSHVHEWLPAGLFLAGAAVMLSAVIGILVELTNFGSGIDAAFAALIGYIAVLLAGAAATWWAHLELKARREVTEPSA